jgi:periplasmic divalent cation tolerance protein
MVTLLTSLVRTIFPMTDAIVVLCACPNQEEAASLARRLVERRLAACVTVSSAHSFYRWQGAIESAEECLLLIKTLRGQFDLLRREIESVHSYQVPEVLALPVVAGSPNYLDWLAASLEAWKGGSEESSE